MDTLLNLRAFLAVARASSFVAAARDLHVVPSVVTKRINQLEWQLKVQLFERNTRRVLLTAAGQRYLGDARRIVGEVDSLLADAGQSAKEIQGHLRIKVPTSLAMTYLSTILQKFLQSHPKVTMEVMALDRPVNPVDEGFDLVLTLMPHAFEGIAEEPLCAVKRSLCASSAYLEQHGLPQTPADLQAHEILNFSPTGNAWELIRGERTVNIHVYPRLSTNDAQLLLSCALAGQGIALLSAYLANQAIAERHLQVVLPEYSLSDLWLKALVPEHRIAAPHIQALIQWLKEALTPAPWDISPQQATSPVLPAIG